MLQLKKIYIIIVCMLLVLSNAYADEKSDYQEYLEYQKFKEEKAKAQQNTSNNYNNSKKSNNQPTKSNNHDGSLGFYLGGGGILHRINQKK